MPKPKSATHIFLFRRRRHPITSATAMQGAIPAQEAAIKALEAFGWEFCTGGVEFGARENTGARLGRIADAHHKYVGEAGLTSGDCNECGLRWPCPTYAWATQDRSVMACWDPADDEEVTTDER